MVTLFLLVIVSLFCTNNGALREYLTEKTILCHKCKKFHLGICYTSMKHCQLTHQQSCAIENIYLLTKRGRSLYYYSILSCMTNCEDVNFLGFQKKTELICCKHDSYCNIPQGS
ncbi:PREDICTED: prostate and testis expressed protein 2 [Miniopterus natalensis]|uniref:prostate and testis expressed protein 2 n=1 Tax=Miniopterus natalensis TaxID=291302 RepID=UPI0007A6F8C6|nr:PREDICTED: prostate and testis expressed protein 2 [Miniopterus natalensis]